MKTIGTHALAKGQVWKTRVAAFEIMAVGRQMIHYKVTHGHKRKRVSAQLSGIEAMAKYLKNNEARLVKGPSNN